MTIGEAHQINWLLQWILNYTPPGGMVVTSVTAERAAEDLADSAEETLNSGLSGVDVIHHWGGQARARLDKQQAKHLDDVIAAVQAEVKEIKATRPLSRPAKEALGRLLRLTEL